MSAQSQCDNVCTKSLLYVTIRATAITTRKGVRSLLKKLFFGETKKSLYLILRLGAQPSDNIAHGYQHTGDGEVGGGDDEMRIEV